MKKRKCEFCGVELSGDPTKGEICEDCYHHRSAEIERDVLRENVPKSLDCNTLLNGIIGEAELSLRKADFVLHVQNIRKMSFILNDRIQRFNSKGGENNGS